MASEIFIRGKRASFSSDDPIRKIASQPPPVTVGGIVVNNVYHLTEIVRHSAERQEELKSITSEKEPVNGLKIQGLRNPKRSGWESAEK